jgi:hypothetical protein
LIVGQDVHDDYDDDEDDDDDDDDGGIRWMDVVLYGPMNLSEIAVRDSRELLHQA